MTQHEPSPLAETTPHASGAPDANSVDRPGVPQESAAPQPLANAHWLKPEQQISEALPLVGEGRQLTPVYSIANPPHGLSGLVRRLAYRSADYRPRRWMLLMLADRIDVLESNPALLLRSLVSISAAGLGVWGISKLVRRPRFS